MTQLAPVRLLVVDDNGDSRQLLVKTLARKYPEAVIHECRQADPAVALAQRKEIAAIVAHRTFDYDGETLIALLRRVNPRVPIVMVSGYDRTERALAAGADAFLNYDQWLMIGTVVGDAMAKKQGLVSGADSGPEVSGGKLAPQSA